MIDESHNPWKVLSTKEIYDNPWIKVREHQVINPSGNKGIYGVISPKNYAIGIVPLDEDYNTWIVGQYRFSINRYSWEIPEGGGPVDEDILESAKRELMEETGIKANKWQQVMECYTSNSIMDEKGFIFIARDLTFGEAKPTETEELQIRKLPFSEVVEMAMKGEITDALALSGIFKVKLMMDRGEI